MSGTKWLWRLGGIAALLGAAGPAGADEPAATTGAQASGGPATTGAQASGGPATTGASVGPSPSLDVAGFRVVLPRWMPPVSAQPGLDVISAYAFRATEPASGPYQWFHAFEVPRAIGSLKVAAGPAAAGLAVEGVYSSSEGALVGVAGDSFVVRVREARAGFRVGEWLAVDAGIVATFVIPTLDEAFRLRALGPVGIEQRGVSSPADLGITARAVFPRGYGFAGAAAYNGEGYDGREINRGKNIEVAALVHPLPGGALAPIGIFAAYQNGSSGTGLSRADRVTGALLWEGERVRGGAAFTYAFGVHDEGAREASVVDVSLRGEPVERLVLAGRFSAYLRDMASPEDRVLSVTGAVGYRLAPPLEVFLALTRSMPSDAAEASASGSSFWEGRSAARFAF